MIPHWLIFLAVESLGVSILFLGVAMLAWRKK